MLNTLTKLGRRNTTILLIAMSLFCFGLSIARYLITDTKTFLFLNWNLFLAFIPWLLSTIWVVKGLNKQTPLVLLMMAWLLFFPNSPYILTDLFHLQLKSAAPIWFDLILILSFAWTGLMYGFISLMDITTLLKKYISERSTTIITVLYLFLASFGVYLGRYLRWNSWDIISNPLGLFSDIINRFIDPFSHPRTWGMTILLGILLNMMFFSIRLLSENKH